MNSNMIVINGEDGGGQILRSALSLSMITGQSFRMVNIRGQRQKPGLMRQHLTCVKAALEVSGGSASGDEINSTELVFRPSQVKSGEYVFKIGSAGSALLLFQTILPVLMLADGDSSLEIHGGTHNPMAPSADFVKRAFLPQLDSMGVKVGFDCVRMGFAPAGGGVVRANIQPAKRLGFLSIMERGAVVSRDVESVVAHVRDNVARREVDTVKSVLEWDDECFSVRNCEDVDGSGNVLYVEEVYENVAIHITSLGGMKKSAERVAKEAVKAYRKYEKSKAAVGPRLADQLLLPMALAGSGELTTQSVTNHIRTNMRLIEQFLDVRFEVEELEGGLVHLSVK